MIAKLSAIFVELRKYFAFFGRILFKGKTSNTRQHNATLFWVLSKQTSEVSILETTIVSYQGPVGSVCNRTGYSAETLKTSKTS